MDSSILPQELYKLYKQSGRVDRIDVRTPDEYGRLHAMIARNIPLDQLNRAAATESRSGEPDAPFSRFCGRGGRSAKACGPLSSDGVTHVVNVEGGMPWNQRKKGAACRF